MKVTLKIKNTKKQDVIDTLKRLFPIQQIPDPTWDVSGKAAPIIPEFTDDAWVTESIQRWLSV